MENKRHELCPADKELFENMAGKYVSQNEANFFKNIQYKEEYELTGLNDLLFQSMIILMRFIWLGCIMKNI